MPQNWKRSFNSMFWTTTGLVFFITIIYAVGKNIQSLVPLIERAGFFGPFVTIALYGILSVTPITTDPLTIVSGVLFKPIVGILVSWMGNNFAALIEYFFGRSIRSMTNFEEQKEQLPLGLNKVPADSLWFLLLARLLPGYGGKLVSIVAGVYHVPKWRYLWTTILVNLFGAVLFSYGGYNLIHLLKWQKFL